MQVKSDPLNSLINAPIAGGITRRQVLKTGTRIIAGAAAGTCLGPFFSGCSDQTLPQIFAAGRTIDIRQLQLTVVYDNIWVKKGLRPDWGFSCLVRIMDSGMASGIEQILLFDSGKIPEF